MGTAGGHRVGLAAVTPVEGEVLAQDAHGPGGPRRRSNVVRDRHGLPLPRPSRRPTGVPGTDLPDDVELAHGAVTVARAGRGGLHPNGSLRPTARPEAEDSAGDGSAIDPRADLVEVVEGVDHVAVEAVVRRRTPGPAPGRPSASTGTKSASLRSAYPARAPRSWPSARGPG